MRLAIQPVAFESLRAIGQKLADLITQLLSRAAKVPAVARVTAISPAAANTAFTLSHTLGSVPEGAFHGLGGTNVAVGVVYASEDDKRAWTDSSIVVRCTAVSVPIDIYVFTTQ